MIIGIDLGGTKILTALATSKGKIISTVKFDTQARLGKKHVLYHIIESVKFILNKSKVPLSKVSRIGVGAPGPVIKGSTIVSPPNLPGWKKVNLKAVLQKAFKKPVIVENDANAAALAEHLFGAGKKAKNVVYLTISTGIGGGIIINNALYRGATGTAGEIGHIIIDPKGPKCGCGNRGCLEAMASGTAIARMAGKKNALEVEIAAKKGDKRSRKAIQTAAKYIGMCIGSLNSVLNPDIVIIGGGISNMGEMLLGPVRRHAREYSMPGSGKHLKIVPAKLKNNSGVMGATAICLAR